jgi:arylsulfatase A-like enzyme/Flp pilus assembly protein TadD
MRHHNARPFLAGVCTVILLTLAACNSSPKKAAAPSNASLKKINVVLVTLDTTRPDHLHCYGYDKIQTPNIDSLAKRGVQFEKAVAQTPTTQPSHASMFTGQNPNVNGVRNTGGFALQPTSVTLATILHNHGWDTAAFVSASVLKSTFGFNQGFTTYDDHITAAPDGNNIAVRPGNITVDHAIHWLDNRKATPNKPFFLWVHLFDAHQPYHPPPPFDKEYKSRPYDGEVAFLDQQVGRLLQAVDKESPESKTLVVLLSDHGQGLGQHGEYEHGIFLYDSTIRIAWVMAGPGIPADRKVEQQAREIDLLPTVLNLLGGNASDKVQGTTLVPAFHGEPVPTTYSYEETLTPKIDMGWSALFGIRTNHWMYVRAPKPELYNLEKDPGELDNVISKYPKEYRELNAELEKLSRVDGKNPDSVVQNEMDPATMKQLASLGYVSGFSGRTVELNGKGDDPKDHVATLKALEVISNTKSKSQAIELMRQAIEADPKNPTLYGWLIDAYQKSGQNSEAIQTCLKALQLNITGQLIYSKLASLYLQQGDIEKAIDYYQKDAQANPLDVSGQNNLATAYLQTGRFSDAERTFKWVLAVQPYAPAYNGLGIIAMRRNNLKEARKEFDRAVQLDPNNVEANLNLGILCTKTQDLPCARAAFKKFLAKAPADEYKGMIPKVKYALTHLLDQGT